MAEITGHDRATIVKYLENLNPAKNSKNIKQYVGVIAIGLIIEKAGTRVRWSEIMTNLTNECLNKLNFTEKK